MQYAVANMTFLLLSLLFSDEVVVFFDRDDILHLLS